MTCQADGAARERLAGLIAHAARGPKPAALVLFLTSSGGLHHMLNCPPGALGVLVRGPDSDGLEFGVSHVSVAESAYIETVLAYLLVTAVADLAANAPEPMRRVGEVYFKRVDEVWEEPTTALILDLHGNMSDLAPGITTGAALLQRPLREFIDTVPGMGAGFQWLESAAAAAGVRIGPGDSWAGIMLRALRARPDVERERGFRGQVLETSDGAALHATSVYLRALALNDRWPGTLGNL